MFSVQNFPRIQQQGRWIASAYKLVGLYSVPLLTIVTIISMSNVFTAGTFAHWPYIATIWAVIFSVAIDVNIVRLFLESKINEDRGAFCIGLGLCLVTAAALFIEGIEQSIGLNWDTDIIRSAIFLLVGLRVILVIVLMAREGRRLGEWLLTLPQSSPPISVQIVPELATDSVQNEPVEAQEIAPEMPALHLVESPSGSAGMSYPKYTPEEAVALDICKQSRVKVRDIRAAISSGELIGNSKQQVSKTALEKWLASRAKSTA